MATVNHITDIYLSTNNVSISALSVNGPILSAGVDLFNLGLGGGGGTITGTGTDGAITRWTGSTSIGNSIITEDTGAITVAGTLSAQGIIYTQEQQVVKTRTTTMPGNSAVTAIVAVSALPVTPEIGTLYILV